MMTEKTVYVADDGVEFESEEDCFEYELRNELDDAHIEIHAWDEHFQPVRDLFKDKGCANSISYVLLNTDEEAVFFQKIADSVGFMAPWENGYKIPDTPHAGAFYYNYDLNAWQELNNELKELNNIHKLFYNTDIEW